jgi:uncharacterized transporter YbjL
VNTPLIATVIAVTSVLSLVGSLFALNKIASVLGDEVYDDVSLDDLLEEINESGSYVVATAATRVNQDD